MILWPAGVGAEKARLALVFIAVEPAYHRRNKRVVIDNAVANDHFMAQ